MDNQYLLPMPVQVDPKVAFPRKSQPKVSTAFSDISILSLHVITDIFYKSYMTCAISNQETRM